MKRWMWAVLPLCLGLAPKPCVVDSHMTLQQALAGKSIPAEILAKQRLVEVNYLGMDGLQHCGQLVLHHSVEAEVRELFELLTQEKFPIFSCIPISAFGWDDEASMAANNTSAFNYRKIAGSKLISKHALGIALDINPMQNPEMKRGKVRPKGAKYQAAEAGTIAYHSPMVPWLKQRGWRWGGSWPQGKKDYMHFQKERWQ